MEAEPIRVEAEWMKVLKKGNLFVKHHKWGKPKLRLIFSNADVSEIYWADPSMTTKIDANSKFKGKILTSEIKDVRDGFIKAKKASVGDKIECCFTIRTKNRTIELEAPTKVSLLKDLYVDRKQKKNGN